MKTEVLHKESELIISSDEIGLAIDLDHHTHLAAQVNVALDQALFGRAIRLLGGRRCSFLAKDRDRFLDIPVGVNESAFAVHESGTRLGAELVDHLCSNGSAHFNSGEGCTDLQPTGASRAVDATRRLLALRCGDLLANRGLLLGGRGCTIDFTFNLRRHGRGQRQS